MGQKKPPTVADLVVTVPFGGFAADQGTLGDRAADAAEYPGLPTSSYLPTDRPRGPLPSRDPAPRPQPPRASIASMLQMPSAALGAAMGSMIGQAPETGTTARLQQAVPAAARAAFHAPFQDAPTSPAQEAAKRGVSDLEGLPGLAFDILSDPTNLVGGDPVSDVMKIGAVAGPGAVKGLARLYSRLTEEVLPRLSKSQHPNKVRSVLKSFASADEVAVTGLEDFLKSKGDKPVTLEEVQQHLQDNKYELRETVYGHGDPKLAEASLKQDKLQRSVIAPMSVWAEQLDEMHPVRDMLEGMQADRPGALVDTERGWDAYLEQFGAVAEAPLLKKIDAFRLPDGNLSTAVPRVPPTREAVEEAFRSRPAERVEMFQDLTTGQLHDRTAAMEMTAPDTGMGTVIVPDAVLRQFPGVKTVGDLARNFGRVLEESEALGGVALDAVPTFKQAPKYERYTLPGDKRDYREVLLHLPDVKLNPPSPEELASANAVLAKVNPGRPGYAGMTVDNAGSGWSWDTVGARAVKDGIVTEQEYNLAHDVINRSRTQGARYTHGHWPGEQDQVTHLRFDTRRVGDADALFLEEVQSDWDQAAREKGYADPKGRPALEKAAQDKVDELREFVVAYGPTYGMYVDDVNRMTTNGRLEDMALRIEQLAQHGIEDGYFDPGTEGRLDRARVTIAPNPELATQARRLLDTKLEAQTAAIRAVTGVADQPFKGTKATELGVKRALLEAVDQGLDHVGWTTGQQQAARYNNLLRDVQEVVWEPMARSEAYAPGSGPAPDAGVLRVGGRNIEVNKKDLHQYIGRENAEKLLAAKDRPTYGLGQMVSTKAGLEGEGVVGKPTMDRLQKNYVNARQFIDMRTGRVKKNGYIVNPQIAGDSDMARKNKRWLGVSPLDSPDVETPPWRQLYDSEADAKAAMETWLDARAEQGLGYERYRLDTSENPLTIGSRGMDQQYDEVMVAQFNKLGKPYGAKAELVPISGKGRGSRVTDTLANAFVDDADGNGNGWRIYPGGEYDDLYDGLGIHEDERLMEYFDPEHFEVFESQREAEEALEEMRRTWKRVAPQLEGSVAPSPHRRAIEGAVVEPYNSRESEVMLEHPADEAGLDRPGDFEGFRVRIDDEAELWDAIESGDVESNVFDRHLNRAFRTREEAVKALNKMKAEAKRLWPAEEPEKVWRFSIPQKMRDDLATRGLPLMAVAPVGLDEDATLEDRAKALGLGVLGVVLSGKFGKAKAPAMAKMLEDLAKQPADLSRAAKKAGLTGTVEENALALYKMRHGKGGESHVGMARAMKDAGIALPAKTGNEKALANAYVKEMLKRAATPAGPAEGPFAGAREALLDDLDRVGSPAKRGAPNLADELYVDAYDADSADVDNLLEGADKGWRIQPGNLTRQQRRDATAILPDFEKTLGTVYPTEAAAAAALKKVIARGAGPAEGPFKAAAKKMTPAQLEGLLGDDVHELLSNSPFEPILENGRLFYYPDGRATKTAGGKHTMPVEDVLTWLLDDGPEGARAVSADEDWLALVDRARAKLQAK